MIFRYRSEFFASSTFQHPPGLPERMIRVNERGILRVTIFHCRQANFFSCKFQCACFHE